MRLFITGATGLIGRRLVAERLARGDTIVVLSRGASRARQTFADATGPALQLIEGDPMRAGDWQASVSGCDAIVNLAGAGIADRRWTGTYKKLLRDSRIETTKNIVAAIRDASPSPSVLINASAVGYYGDTGVTEVDEDAEPGDDFLARLCDDWEEAALEAQSRSTRVVLLRFGVIVDGRGGALGKMLTPFKLFVGGPIGSGRQFMPWIHWRDVVGIVDLALTDADVCGPINCVAPQPVTNREFSRAFGKSLGRPSWLPAPPPALRLILGEFVRTLSMSQRIVPARALQHGYEFRFDDIDAAMYDAAQKERG